MDIQSIDHLLTGTPEYTKTQVKEPEQQHENEQIDDNYAVSEEINESPSSDYNESSDDDTQEVSDSEMDDYGNEVQKDSDVIRERLKRQAESMERRHQAELDALRAELSRSGVNAQTQKAVSDFEINPDSDDSWQTQLKSFVEQTVSQMSQRDAIHQQNIREQNIQREFETKFVQGMDRFSDFRQVVGSQPITDEMTYALRGMNDPAAFIYAASKQQPAELQRISSIRDPYAQIAEMGKLEERMRKTKSVTQAPRPISRTKDDATIKPIKKKEDSFEDVLAKADAKRMAQIQKSRGRK